MTCNQALIYFSLKAANQDQFVWLEDQQHKKEELSYVSSPVLESQYGGLCAIRSITIIIHMEVRVLMELRKSFAGNSIIQGQVHYSTDNYQSYKTS